MIKDFVKPKDSIFWINFWPTYFIQGISAKQMNKQMTHIQVTLKERFYNLNYVGTHFGGTLYSMSDPWYMLILIKHLGEDYIVWDKSAAIKFIRPGRGTITGQFEIPHSQIEAIKKEVDHNESAIFTFKTFIKDKEGKRVARITKEVFVKKK